MKKWLAAVAALVLLTCGARAAFPDNPPGTWYYDAIEHAQAAGWINGYADGGAHPEDVLTKEQAITVLTRVLGYEPVEVGGFWSAGYVMRGVVEGYVEDTENLSLPISRYDTARMLYKAYDLEGMGLPQGESPFSDIESPEVSALYTLGIVTGAEPGRFVPEGELSRAQLCVMLKRVGESPQLQAYLAGEAEKTFELHSEYLLTQPEWNPVLSDDESLINAMIYLCLSGQEEAMVTIRGTREEASQVVDRMGAVFQEMTCLYPEYFSVYDGYNIRIRQEDGQWAGTLVLQPKEGIGLPRAGANRELFFEATGKAIRTLFEEGALNLLMSDTEKAAVWAAFIAEKASYDLDFAESSFYGLDFFGDGTLVCNGYTALYDLGLRLMGIQCFGVGGTTKGVNHIWTMAYLDGAWKTVDLTYMDQGGIEEIDDRYFAIDEETLMNMGDERVKWEITIPTPQP